MKELQACIFDLDGVIVDTAKYHYLGWKRLGRELGIEFTEHDNERLKGVSRRKSLEILLSLGDVKPASEQQMLDWMHRKNNWYVEYIKAMQPDEILPGVTDFLKELQARKIHIALGSASKNAATVLERVGLSDVFEVRMDGNSVTTAKPNPELFLKCAEGLGVDPTYCTVFEDALAGVQAAHNAGMFAIGVGKPEILGVADLVIPGFAKFGYTEFISAYQSR